MDQEQTQQQSSETQDIQSDQPASVLDDGYGGQDEQSKESNRTKDDGVDVSENGPATAKRAKGQAVDDRDDERPEGEQSGAELGGDEGEQGSSERVSSALARIARQEAKVRARLEQRSQSLAQKEREIAEREHIQAQIDRGLAMLESDLDGGLQLIGQAKGMDLSYASLTKAALSGKLDRLERKQDNEETQTAAEQKLAALEQKLQAMENQKRGLEYKSAVADTLSGGAYKAIEAEARAKGITPVDLVGDYILQHAQHTGSVPDESEIGQTVESINRQLVQYHKLILGDSYAEPERISKPKQRRPIEEPMTLHEGLNGASQMDDDGGFSSNAMRNRAEAAIAALRRANGG